MIPEGLAGKLVGRGGDEPGQNGLAIPRRQLGFAGGVSGAVDGSQDQVGSDRETLMPFGDLGVDQVHQAQLNGLVVEGSDVGEAGDFGFLWRQGLLGRCYRLNDVVEGTQVESSDDLRSAVNALAPAGVIIGAAADKLASQARHC